MSAHDQAHSTSHYVKIWGILLVLLVVSLIGPELGNKYITLITAFGIAFVKAWMVCVYFMHMNIEKKYVWYMMAVSFALIGVFMAGTSSEVYQHSGQNWKDCLRDNTCVELRAP